MKITIILIILSFLLAYSSPSILNASNIQADSVMLVSHDSVGQTIQVRFNLSWEHSWRTDTAPGNHDAAWVFLKYSVNGEDMWHHALPEPDGHSSGHGTPALVQPGLMDEQKPFEPDSNPAIGAFFYRSQNGSGKFSIQQAHLLWNYGAQGISHDDTLAVKVFAIEMVYIPEGPFFLGSGASESGEFYTYPYSDSAYLVNSEDAITTGDSVGLLYYPHSTHSGDQSGIIPKAFPKGYQGYYVMKYSITQQQYVDFLNTITPSQAQNRMSQNTGFRYAITDSTGTFTTAHPYVACNFLSWPDGAAYAHWAGLRPMTETEYEKACRGPLYPVKEEYAWGNTQFVQAAGIDNPGTAHEAPTNMQSNAVAGFNHNVQGPMRVGAFATDSSDRTKAGASYYGIMELSGNVTERTVTIGNNQGRAFDGKHGNGTITTCGHANINSWPGNNNGIVNQANGSGIRGGDWINCVVSMRVSNRGRAAFANQNRSMEYGFRAARTKPKIPAL